MLSRKLHGSHGVRALKFYNMEAEMKNVGKLLKTLGSSLEELDLGFLCKAQGFKDSDAKGQHSALID